MEPVIIVHGGAWAIPADLTDRSLAGVREAAVAGYRLLEGGASAVDAVVAAVRSMEDNPVFDAGHGAVLTLKGEVELDAIVIDGRTLQSGAVAAVQDIANPVALAKMVMEKTDHCLLVGRGANDFAQEHGVPRLVPDQLVTEEAKRELEMYLKYSSAVNTLFNRTDQPPLSGCDTVGAVAMDTNGNLASATSTGGITAKRPGRVGDTPIIGAGAYADNLVGAASATGHGESIMKVCLTRRIGEFMEQGQSAQQATETALSIMVDRVGGRGGAVVIGRNGEMAHHFTTTRMAWASVAKGNLTSGIDPGVEFKDTI